MKTAYVEWKKRVNGECVVMVAKRLPLDLSGNSVKICEDFCKVTNMKEGHHGTMLIASGPMKKAFVFTFSPGRTHITEEETKRIIPLPKVWDIAINARFSEFNKLYFVIEQRKSDYSPH